MVLAVDVPEPVDVAFVVVEDFVVVAEDVDAVEAIRSISQRTR